MDKLIISIEAYGNKYEATLPADAHINDVIQTFYGLCVATSYLPITVLDGMGTLVTEQKSVLYGKD